MAEYVTKEQVIDWFIPYGHLDKPITFETLVSDLRCMKAADVLPVRHGRWIEKQEKDTFAGYLYSYECSECGRVKQRKEPYCPNCGARMDEEVKHER